MKVDQEDVVDERWLSSGVWLTMALTTLFGTIAMGVQQLMVLGGAILITALVWLAVVVMVKCYGYRPQLDDLTAWLKKYDLWHPHRYFYLSLTLFVFCSMLLLLVIGIATLNYDLIFYPLSTISLYLHYLLVIAFISYKSDEYLIIK